MLTLEQVRRACRGKVIRGAAEDPLTSVQIDSRRAAPGALFVAIKGERYDGHQFAAQAVRNGARAVVVSRPVRVSGAAVIQVRDTVRALGQIAALRRRAFSGQVIAITGSAGKTSTRRMVAAVLGAKYRVLQSARSENNWIGVPLTLFKLTPEHQVAVVEAGTNQPGDMAWLTKVIQPDIVIFTNTGEAHLSGLKSRYGVYREKLHLAKGDVPPATVIYNHDDAHWSRLPEEGLVSTLRPYSIDLPSGCRAGHIQCPPAGGVTFRVGDECYRLPVPGRHHIYNALAAIACARVCRVPRDKVRRALARLQPEENRGGLLKTARGVWVLDDTYNANPLSFYRAVDGLANYGAARRCVVVAGDMLELGRAARRLHTELGQHMAEAGVAALFAIGAHTPDTVRAFGRSRPGAVAVHATSLAGLHRSLGRWLNPGDLVLVKGSRSMKMERTVSFLKRKFS